MCSKTVRLKTRCSSKCSNRIVRSERRAAFPGVAEQLEPDNPGMHTTSSVDYVMVLDGDLWLELDDGQLTRLGPGDAVVQNGTRHAWRNLSARPATVAVVQVGAEREGTR